MVYSFIYVNTLYNQLSLNSEVLNASIIVGDSFENLTQFSFERQPTLGVSYDQLERLGYYKELSLTPDPPNHYDLFMQEVSQKTIEIYQELPEIAITFYQFSRKQNFDSVQKWVTLNNTFKKNLRQTIHEEFDQIIPQTDSKTLVKLLLLLYKKHEKIEPMTTLGIVDSYEYTMKNGAIVNIDSLTEQSTSISQDPLT